MGSLTNRITSSPEPVSNPPVVPLLNSARMHGPYIHGNKASNTPSPRLLAEITKVLREENKINARTIVSTLSKPTITDRWTHYLCAAIARHVGYIHHEHAMNGPLNILDPQTARDRHWRYVSRFVYDLVCLMDEMRLDGDREVDVEEQNQTILYENELMEMVFGESIPLFKKVVKANERLLRDITVKTAGGAWRNHPHPSFLVEELLGALEDDWVDVSGLLESDTFPGFRRLNDWRELDQARAYTQEYLWELQQFIQRRHATGGGSFAALMEDVGGQPDEFPEFYRSDGVVDPNDEGNDNHPLRPNRGEEASVPTPAGFRIYIDRWDRDNHDWERAQRLPPSELYRLIHGTAPPRVRHIRRPDANRENVRPRETVDWGTALWRVVAAERTGFNDFFGRQGSFHPDNRIWRRM